MTEDSTNDNLSDVKLFHSFVPHKFRLLTLIGFIRTHLNDKIVVACCNSGVTEFLKLLISSPNFIDIRCDAVHGKQDEKHRQDSIKRFNSGEVSVLIGTSLLLSTIKIDRPTWLIHYDIPKEVPEEIQIIKNIHPEKFILFIDESQKKYLDLLKQVKIVTKEIPHDPKKVPPIQDKIIKITNDKNHLLYMASQSGYRGLIQTYVNHENNDIFNARELNVLDVSINFGIKYPPKLQLSK